LFSRFPFVGAKQRFAEKTECLVCFIATVRAPGVRSKITLACSGALVRLVMTNVSIQILDPENVPLLEQAWQLREAVLRKPLGLSLRDEDLSGEAEEVTLCATDEAGHAIGCLMLRRLSDEELKLRQMAVAPAAQGTGVGRKLLQSAEAFAAEHGYQSISLHARLHALPFYEKAGYRAAGEVFTEVGIPHRLMRKSI
jgi:predicted GNAT family N-acyltransferase